MNGWWYFQYILCFDSSVTNNRAANYLLHLCTTASFSPTARRAHIHGGGNLGESGEATIHYSLIYLFKLTLKSIYREKTHNN